MGVGLPPHRQTDRQAGRAELLRKGLWPSLPQFQERAKMYTGSPFCSDQLGAQARRPRLPRPQFPHQQVRENGACLTDQLLLYGEHCGHTVGEEGLANPNARGWDFCSVDRSGTGNVVVHTGHPSMQLGAEIKGHPQPWRAQD